MSRVWSALGASVALSISSTVAAQAFGPVCRALINSRNDLYLVSDSGAVISRFTGDGEPKSSIVLSPDGSKVAYLDGVGSQTITVSFADGRSATIAVPMPSGVSTNTLEGVRWNSNSVLDEISHVSPSERAFNFYVVTEDGRVAPMSRVGTRYGQDCSVARESGNDVGCVDGSNITSGMVGIGVLPHYSVNMFETSSVTQLGSQTLVVGGTATFGTAPQLIVSVVSIVDGITVRITPPDDAWVEGTVADDAPFAFDIDDKHYAFRPNIVDRRKGTVSVEEVQSKFGESVFDPVSAPYGQGQVAVVERAPFGAELVIVNTRSNARSPLAGPLNIEPIESMYFARTAREPLTDDEEAQSERVRRSALLVFKTSSGFGYLPVTIDGSQKLQIGSITRLPDAVNVSLTSGTERDAVLAWSCGYR